MIFLRPMRSESRPKTTNSGVPSASATETSKYAGCQSSFSALLQERERVELARVPDDALSRGRAEEREQHVPEVDAGW